MSALAVAVAAQTIFVPSGTTGIGTSSNGYVGIGTANPTHVFDVRGDVIAIDNGANNYGGNVAFKNSVHHWRAGMLGSPGWDRFSIYDVTLGAERLTINTAGNVGIGTSNPAANLDVAGTAVIGTATSRPITLGTDWGRIYIQGDTGGWAFGLHAKGASGTPRAGFGFYGEADNLHYLYIGNSHDSPTMVVQSAVGNVGIGTTSPSHKLSVNGTIRAKEVIVDTGWADYVFADDYRLAPLSEVEAHIKEHKHLPDMPSAAEVAEKGVSMGEMQARMMAKIEELTLHLIELKKENAWQSEQIRRLENENAGLRKP